ncbi:MAG TPA: glycosyltransferase N-terminal domain-containing protein [Chitinophagaceae bacterium]|nr:glycosyltransferase N-terminal domain-containing protein [Chitinophagaceae bacterium]
MLYLYNFIIRFYILIAKLLSFWNQKAKSWIDGRGFIFQKVLVKKKENAKVYWFHCASVGEFEQAMPLIELYKKQYASLSILITFYSPSGFEYAQRKYPDEWISYLPFDIKSDIAQFIDTVQPDKVFIVKYEFWYHLLDTLSERKIPTYLVSGIFRKEQIFFKWYGSFFRKILSGFTHFFVQDENSKQLLNSIQFENVTIIGDTRFDRVVELKKTNFYDKKLNSFFKNQPIFIAGSIWESDIPIINKIIMTLPKGWKIILVPHEISNFPYQKIKLPFIKYSKIEQEEIDERVVCVDAVGILSKIYRYARFAYVGGGFGKGIHNLLEPAVYGIPVLIGPKHQKFIEAKKLIEMGVAFEINLKNTENIISNHILNEQALNTISNSITNLLSNNSNLSSKMIVLIEKNEKKEN